MEKVKFLLRYVYFFFVAKDEHSIHSPFVYKLYTTLLKNTKQFYSFEEIERLRKSLLKSNKQIQVTDFGAGSKKGNSSIKKIGNIVKYSEKPAFLAQLLFRLVNNFRPSTILELGTSFGLTTIYLNKANPSAKVFTLEGCPQTIKIARENFSFLQTSNITPICGNIDDTLKEILNSVNQVDFVFFDANHRYQPTMEYFQLCLTKAHEDSIFVFDDIHWSSEMEKAWEEIKMHPRVMITIDIFHMGLVFFRQKQPKQHYILKI